MGRDVAPSDEAVKRGPHHGEETEVQRRFQAAGSGGTAGGGGAAVSAGDRHPPAGCVHHSHRGVQYACEDYVKLLSAVGLCISMSRQANPYDNAQAESFFKALKHEEVYLTQHRNSEEAAV